MEAEPREVGREARLRAGDAQVRHQRQAEPAADRRAVDGADDRLGGAEEAHRLDVEVARLPRLGLLDQHVLHVGAVAELGAGAEGGALGRQHDGAAGVVLVERLAGVGDLADQLDVEEVVRRPPDLDGRHHVGEIDADVLERAHVVPPQRFRLSPLPSGRGREAMTYGRGLQVARIRRP